MTIKQKITSDTVSAQKAGSAARLGTLRMVLSALQSKEIEKRGKGDAAPLTDEEASAVLMKEAKKRTEAAALYAKGGREDLKKKEEEELEVIYTYVPRPLSREEVEKVVEAVIAEGNPRTQRAEQSSYDGTREFPAAMKEVAKRLAGRADGKMVAEIVKEKLAA